MFSKYLEIVGQYTVNIMKLKTIRHRIFENNNSYYQSPSLVMFAEGYIFFKAAGTFPANAGSTIIEKCKDLINHTIQTIQNRNSNESSKNQLNSNRKLNYTWSHA